MENIKLDKEEAEILKEVETGRFRRVKGADKAKYRDYARYTLRKTRSINVRISEKDLQKVKALAAEKGLPYQTLISALLHQYSKRKAEEAVF